MKFTPKFLVNTVNDRVSLLWDNRVKFYVTLWVDKCCQRFYEPKAWDWLSLLSFEEFKFISSVWTVALLNYCFWGKCCIYFSFWISCCQLVVSCLLNNWFVEFETSVNLKSWQLIYDSCKGLKNCGVAIHSSLISEKNKTLLV